MRRVSNVLGIVSWLVDFVSNQNYTHRLDLVSVNEAKPNPIFMTGLIGLDIAIGSDNFQNRTTMCICQVTLYMKTLTIMIVYLNIVFYIIKYVVRSTYMKSKKNE